MPIKIKLSAKVIQKLQELFSYTSMPQNIVILIIIYIDLKHQVSCFPLYFPFELQLASSEFELYSDSSQIYVPTRQQNLHLLSNLPHQYQGWHLFPLRLYHYHLNELELLRICCIQTIKRLKVAIYLQIRKYKSILTRFRNFKIKDTFRLLSSAVDHVSERIENKDIYLIVLLISVSCEVSSSYCNIINTFRDIFIVGL